MKLGSGSFLGEFFSFHANPKSLIVFLLERVCEDAEHQVLFYFPPHIEKTTRQKSNNIYLAKLHTTLMWGEEIEKLYNVGGEVEKYRASHTLLLNILTFRVQKEGKFL